MLLDPGSYCTRSLAMFYQAMYHELPSCGLWVTTPWTILYLSIDNMLHGCVSWATELWTPSTSPCNMSFWSQDHFIPGHQPCVSGLCTMCYRAMDTFFKVVDYESLCPGTWSTGPLIMCYRAVDTFYLDVGHVLLGSGLSCSGPSTMWFRAVYHIPYSTRPWTRSTWAWNMC